MLFKIQREILLKLFKLALFVANEKKAVNNIVSSHVLLELQRDIIKLIATDLEVELIVVEELSAEQIENSGILVVPFRKINEILRAMPENLLLQIQASSTDSNLKLKIASERGFFDINCLSAENFPTITNKEFNSTFSIQSRLMHEILSKVTFAMGDHENRHFLNGVFLQFGLEKIISVATDGHRLMVWEVQRNVSADLIQNLPQEISILIPRKSVFDILKIITENDFKESYITILIGISHVRLEFNNIIYTSKLLNALFPSYKRLIPTNYSNRLMVEREQLKKSCLMAAAVLGDRSQVVKIGFNQDGLIIHGASEHGDSVKENIPANLQGQELAIYFNIQYLLDFLGNNNTIKVVFKFQTAIEPVLMQDLGLDGLELDSLYLLMPMQV